MTFKGRGAVRHAAEMMSPLAAITDRLIILGAPDDMIENLAWQWDNFDDEWTPERQAELHHWSDDRLFREVTGILAEYHDSTTEVDDPRAVKLIAARLAASSSMTEVLDWCAESPALRVPAAIEAESLGKQRGKLIKALVAMRP